MIKAIIFDYSNTIEDIETGKLYPEVPIVLKDLRKKALKLALVSRASDLEERLKEFKQLNLKDYFDLLDVVTVGNNKEFGPIIEKLGVKSEEVLVVGDRVRSEILEGNKIGCKTVWIRRGIFMDEMPESDLEKPDFIIKDLLELLPIIDLKTS